MSYTFGAFSTNPQEFAAQQTLLAELSARYTAFRPRFAAWLDREIAQSRSLSTSILDILGGAAGRQGYSVDKATVLKSLDGGFQRVVTGDVDHAPRFADAIDRLSAQMRTQPDSAYTALKEAFVQTLRQLPGAFKKAAVELRKGVEEVAGISLGSVFLVAGLAAAAYLMSFVPRKRSQP